MTCLPWDPRTTKQVSPMPRPLTVIGRDMDTCTSTTNAAFDLDMACPAQPAAAATQPAASCLPSPTARLARSVLVMIGGATMAAARSDQGPQLPADPSYLASAEGRWPDGMWTAAHQIIVECGTAPYLYIVLGLLLLLLLLLPRLVRRPGVVRKGNTGLVLPAMAFLGFASLLLYGGLHLRVATAQYGQSTVLWTSQKPSQTASAGPEFTIPASADNGMNILPNVKDPQAVDPQAVCPGYRASNVRESDNGLTADLDLAGPACDVYGNDVHQLVLSVEYQANDRIHVEIKPRYIGPENETWFLLPEELVPRPSSDSQYDQTTSDLAVSWSNDPTFSFTVTRKQTGDTLFSTKGRVLVYEDQFIEFVSPLPENYNLYGLGDVFRGFRLGNNLTRTLYTADVGDVIDANLYGSHPIYLDTRYFANSSGKLVHAKEPTDKTAKYVSYTHGVFLRNAHGQEVLLRPSGITWRTLGGSIDLYFYNGPTATDVIKTYQQTTVGLPAMQQYWTLGFHQCRWGYKSWKEIEEIVDDFAKFEIPLETIWTDIDYMNQYRDFENDPVRFGYDEGAEFLAKLHANGQHYVPIVDSAIYAPNPEDPSDAYPPYDRGIEANAFILNPDGSIYYGAVWPGYTVFPDWVGAVLNGTGANDWWIKEISAWSKKVAYDGIWIDMSEVSSFCTGSCGTGNLTLNPAHPPFLLPGEPGNLVLDYPEGFELTNASEARSASSALQTQQSTATATATTTTTPYYRTTPTPGTRNINWPPYAINNYAGDLATHATSPNATHHGGTREYDFHNLFGHLILRATHASLLTTHPGKRPFLIGRSTFAGSGRYAGHWGGDNSARWEHMALSIPQALSFSVFGVPMFGVDACGFDGNTDAELCARWMGLAAFFPFYRNHNILGAIPQEPYRWAVVADASRRAMAVRYALLPYLYTLFARAASDGSPVLRAMAWEFPGEPWLADADRQLLVGGGLLVTPCLEQGASTVMGVFPGSSGTVWYDWYTLEAVDGVGPGENVTLDAPLGHIPLHLRGGSVVPVQEPRMTTVESRGTPWGLLVALDRDGAAEGELYLDDGESLEPSEATWVQFSATGTSVSARPEGNYVDTNPLTNVTVLGLARTPSKVWVKGVLADSAHWSYSKEKAVLSLQSLQPLFSDGAWAADWEISWE